MRLVSNLIVAIQRVVVTRVSPEAMDIEWFFCVYDGYAFACVIEHNTATNV